MATGARPQDVAESLVEVGGEWGIINTPTDGETLLGDGAVTRSGTWIRVVQAARLHWDPIVETFGFAPSVSIIFEMDKTTGYRPQEYDMIRLVSELLTRIPGDAVLNFQDGDDDIWLVRINGSVTLSDKDDIWPDERLGLMVQPYIRRRLAWSE
jgi:hypothetical protein